VTVIVIAAGDVMNDAPDVVDEQIEMPDERNVNYVFPVEIVVVGALTDDDHREIRKGIWNEWGDAMGYQSA
jgi:hypothetical protein